MEHNTNGFEEKNNSYSFGKAAEDLRQWTPIGWRLAIRLGFQSTDADDLIQDIAVRFFLYVNRGGKVNKPGAFLTTCLLNRARNFFGRRKRHFSLDTDVVDPGSTESQESEKREHLKWYVSQILAEASPAERRCAEDVAATDDYSEAGDLRLAQEGISAPTARQRKSGYKRICVNMARLRDRLRRHPPPDPAA